MRPIYVINSFDNTKLPCHERTTNRRHLFHSLQWLWQRIEYVGQTKRQFGTRLKEHQKAVFFCKKENSALSEHTYLTNHTIGWDKSKIITTNRCWSEERILDCNVPTQRTMGTRLVITVGMTTTLVCDSKPGQRL